MFGFLRRKRAAPLQLLGQTPIRGKFDSAQTTDANRRHWAMADGLDPDKAASPSVRKILRDRARYEVANNTYGRGIVLTLANDVIGNGPRLQMLTDDEEVNSKLEREFAVWAKATDLAAKLRTMRMARAQDGEAFALLFSNPALASAVKMDLKLIEADQVAAPSGLAPKANAVDGIEYDDAGNPTTYHILKNHPGSDSATGADGDRVAAANVIHWFRADRPGQRRGLPDLLPALPLFAQLRRYTLAVIAAAESAADIAVFMKTSTPAGGECAGVVPMTTMEFEKNMAVFGPEGWEPSQVRAEQPATSYFDFKRAIINEIGRCVNMPYNIAACDSGDSSYSAGKLDHRLYLKSVGVDQAHCEAVVVDRILTAWLAEGVKVYEDVDFAVGVIAEAPHQWMWESSYEYLEPERDANAQSVRLQNHTTTLAAEYAKTGKDWQTELKQRAKELGVEKKLAEIFPRPAAPRTPQREPEPASPAGRPAVPSGSQAPERGRGQPAAQPGGRA